MSQASKVLKEIAAMPEYAAIAQAIEKNDYEAIANSYKQLNTIIEEKKKQILEKIDSLVRQNKGEDRQQFINAFSLRISTTLPQWHRLNLLMQEQKVTEGEVIGVGSKGDPMLRTPDGKLTIISGLTAEKGAKVTLRITKEGEKVNFGQTIEFNPDFFYILLNQTMLTGIRERFNAIEERLKVSVGEITPALLGELLQELEKVRELANGLRQDEKERVNSRILVFRKQLLGEYGVKMAMEFIERQETDEITALCSADALKLTCALAAPGLFRYQSYQAIKAELLNGKELKGYTETLSRLENNLDSMDTALKLMEFKSGFEEVEPSARAYLDKIDILFEKLNRKARIVVTAMAEDKIGTVEDIQSRIETAFAGKGACSEIRGVFRSPTEFFASRESLAKLRAMLGNAGSHDAETAIHPYIADKIHQAFAR
jgi:hypothetical protein